MPYATDKSKTPSLRLKLAGSVFAVGLLSGCIADNMIEPHPQNEVVWVQVDHQVSFAPGRAELAPDEARKIDSFLDQTRLSYGDRVAVAGSPGEADDLAARRAQVVAAYLARHDVTAGQLQASPVALGQDQAGLIVGRYVVVSPECPDWNSVLAGGPIEAGLQEWDTTRRFWLGEFVVPDHHPQRGCVTASALGSMIADPGDLTGGDVMGPGDANALGRSVDAYREGAQPDALTINFNVGGP